MDRFVARLPFLTCPLGWLALFETRDRERAYVEPPPVARLTRYVADSCRTVIRTPSPWPVPQAARSNHNNTKKHCAATATIAKAKMAGVRQK